MEDRSGRPRGRVLSSLVLVLALAALPLGFMLYLELLKHGTGVHLGSRMHYLFPIAVTLLPSAAIVLLYVIVDMRLGVSRADDGDRGRGRPSRRWMDACDLPYPVPLPALQLSFPPGSTLLGLRPDGTVIGLRWMRERRGRDTQLHAPSDLERVGVLTFAVRTGGTWLLATPARAIRLSRTADWLVWPLADRGGSASVLPDEEQERLGFPSWDRENERPTHLELSAADIEAARVRLWPSPAWEGFGRTREIDPSDPLTPDMVDGLFSAREGALAAPADPKRWHFDRTWLQSREMVPGSSAFHHTVEPGLDVLEDRPPQETAFIWQPKVDGTGMLRAVTLAEARRLGLDSCQVCLALHVENHWVLADQFYAAGWRVFPWHVADAKLEQVSRFDTLRSLWKLHFSHWGKDLAFFGHAKPEHVKEVRAVAIGPEGRCAWVETEDETLAGIVRESLERAVRELVGGDGEEGKGATGAR